MLSIGELPDFFLRHNFSSPSCGCENPLSGKRRTAEQPMPIGIGKICLHKMLEFGAE